MMNHRKIDIRVKTGTAWVRIDNVSINFWVTYQQTSLTWYKDEVRYIEIRNLDIPSWAGYYKKTIKDYLENNPTKLYSSKDGAVIDVE